MRRSLILIWCVGGLLAVVLVAGVVVGVRRAGGTSELEAALRRTPADEAWLAALPHVAPGIRERAWAWMKSSWPGGFNGSSAKDDAWFLAGERPPENLLARHAAERSHMERLTKLLAEPGICLSSAAWAEGDRATRSSFGPRHIPNLLSCRNAQRWYGLETMLADDPVPALEASERLFAALHPPGCLIDAMILVAMGATRDRIHLRLLQRGRLPEAHRRRWLEEPPPAADALVSGYRGERLLMWEPLGRAMLRGDPGVSSALYGDDTDPIEHLDYLWHARRDVATILWSHRRFERFVRGEVGDLGVAEMRDRSRAGGRLAQMGMPHHGAVLGSLVHARTRHRLARLLALTAGLSGATPTTEAELRRRLPDLGQWMDPGRLDVAIRYERLGADRIRFFVPADTPLPAVLESQRSSYVAVPGERSPHLALSPLPAVRNAAEMQIRPSR